VVAAIMTRLACFDTNHANVLLKVRCQTFSSERNGRAHECLTPLRSTISSAIATRTHEFVLFVFFVREVRDLIFLRRKI
jgi:hypothetical protein